MSFLTKNLRTRVQEEDVSEEGNDYENDENKCDVKPAKAAFRGCTAALLANLNDDSDDSGEDSDESPSLSKKAGKGIYAMKLSQTKREIKETHNQFDMADKRLLKNDANTKQIKESDSESLLDSDSTDFSNDSFREAVTKKTKKAEKEDSPVALSPPPPPSMILNSKPKRKSTSAVDKQLKELVSIKNKTQSKQLNADVFDVDDLDVYKIESDSDESSAITVKVSTKNGLYKHQLKKNESFKVVFEELAKRENTNMENIVLMLKERRLKFSDTPESVDLKIFDVLDCGRLNAGVQEKIKVIDNEDEFECPSNALLVRFQTQDGRKSRLTFLISKDETFGNVLKKYFEKKEIKDMESYIIEFDGEKVDLSETPIDLDLDGGEIFDVKKCSRPAMQIVTENKKNYDFDDEVLIA